MSAPDVLCPARFVVLAEASPGLLPRLLQPLAKRDLVPDSLHAQRNGETLQVEIAFSAIPAGMAHLIAGNIAQVVGVLSLSQGAGTQRAA